MLYYNKSLEQLGFEKEIEEFQAGIIASRLKQDVEGIDQKGILKSQLNVIYKVFFVGSVFINLMFLIF